MANLSLIQLQLSIRGAWPPRLDRNIGSCIWIQLRLLALELLFGTKLVGGSIRPGSVSHDSASGNPAWKPGQAPAPTIQQASVHS